MQPLQCLRASRCDLFLLFDDQPVRAFLLIHVKAFAIIASHTLTRDDFRSANRAPFAGLLAYFACIAFRPALDSKYSQIREQTKESADWAEEPAV